MKLNKYISLGTLAIVVAGFSSCDSKNDPAYNPAGSVDDAQRVFFASSSISQIVTADTTAFSFRIYRPDLNVMDEDGVYTYEMPAQTVGLISSCSEADVLGSKITVPAEVTFDAGSPYATIDVTYAPDQMTGNYYYPITVTVDPEYANEYSISQTTLRVNKEEYTDWAPFVAGEPSKDKTGEGGFTFSLIWREPWTADVKVISRYVPSNPDDIQFQFQWLIDDEDPSLGWETFMTAYTKDGGKIVHVAPQDSPFSADGVSYLQVADTYTYSGNDKYKGLSTFDPITGLFTLNLYYYDEEGGWGMGDEFLQLTGYKDMNNYELKVSSLGQTNINDTDYALINFDFTEAVSYVDYTFVKGELEAEEIDSVAVKMMDPKQTEYTISSIEKSQNVAVSFPSKGMYTVVAVGYHVDNSNKAEAKVTASTSFFFDTVDPYSDWTVVTEEAIYVDNMISTLTQGQLPPENLAVQVAKSDKYSGLYRITNPYKDSSYIDIIGAELAPFGSIEFVIMEDGRVYFPLSDTGILDGGDAMYLCSTAYYFMAGQGADPDALPAVLFASMEDGTITESATGVQNMPSFLNFYGAEQDGPYLCDMDFYLSISGKMPSGKPAMLKTGKVEKGLAKMNRVSMKKVKTPAFPAFYTAVPQGSKASYDRHSSIARKLGKLK